MNLQVQPGHSIVLVSPLTLVNLLPFDIHYKIKTTTDNGMVKPGENACIHSGMFYALIMYSLSETIYQILVPFAYSLQLIK